MRRRRLSVDMDDEGGIFDEARDPGFEQGSVLQGPVWKLDIGTVEP